MDALTIDGSFGEGGGQILRTCLAFAAITGKPIQIQSIRGGRAKPGLQPQHLASVHAAQTICEAEVKGDANGSLFLSFRPTKPVEPGHFRFDIGTAGSANLVLQTVFPALARCDGPSEVTITGGTHNPMAPSFDYIANVFAPCVGGFGWSLDAACDTPGFFPAGGGRLDVHIEPADPKPIELVAFPSDHLLRSVMVSTIGREDLFTRAHNRLISRHEGKDVPFQFEALEQRGQSEGLSVLLYAANGVHRAGFSALGERRRTMEQVVDGVYDEYEAWAAAKPAVDEHLGDQLAPLAALTPGHSEWVVQKVTEHLRTVLQVIEWFELASTGIDEETGLVHVTV